MRAKDVVEGRPTLGSECGESWELGVEDVWLAPQWIPEDLIASVHRGDEQNTPSLSERAA